MSNIEKLPVGERRLTEYESLVAASPTALEAIPGAVYVCDHDGYLVRFNSEAIDLWGRTPAVDEPRDRYCGSHRLLLLDGTPLPHGDCPMAEAVRTGASIRNRKVVVERPDGSRVVVLVNIQPLRDHLGRIEGAINCFQDISAQNAMEDEIRSKNIDLEDFFENGAI